MAESLKVLASVVALKPKPHFKILFVGDPDCGKTRAIQTYLGSNVPKDRNPTCATYEYDLKNGNSNVAISLVDVRGTGDIGKASECFDSTDVAIFFYAINNLQSLENLRDCWIPRFKMCSGSKVPIILVGSKRDLRASEGQQLEIASLQPNSVPFFHGMKMKISCAMDMFLECSAKDTKSIDCVFQTAYAYII